MKNFKENEIQDLNTVVGGLRKGFRLTTEVVTDENGKTSFSGLDIQVYEKNKQY